MSGQQVPTTRMTGEEYRRLPWTPVESSNLSRVAFVAGDGHGTLYVEFGPGRIYQYVEVPEDLFHEMLDADSIGSFFSQMIRNEYDTTRLIVA